MSVKVLSGFPKKSFFAFLISLFSGAILVLLCMAIPRIFLGEQLYTNLGAFLYIAVSFFLSCTVFTGIVLGVISIFPYDHYNRSLVVLINTLIVVVSAALSILFIMMFFSGFFTSPAGEVERNLRRTYLFNVSLALNPILLIFEVSAFSLYGVLKKSCPKCKILSTVELVDSKVISSKMKRHTHKEKDHYEHDIISYDGIPGQLHTATISRRVEGKVVDDGLFEHKTTEYCYVCKNCGNVTKKIIKTEEKVEE